jgi:hypothetical protein
MSAALLPRYSANLFRSRKFGDGGVADAGAPVFSLCGLSVLDPSAAAHEYNPGRLVTEL